MTRARRGPRSRTASRGRAGARRWVRRVRTAATFPPPGTFSGSAEQIARTMASRGVSPKGVGSGIRMIQYFINRAGGRLPASRRYELERAKRILQAQYRDRGRGRPGCARCASLP